MALGRKDYRDDDEHYDFEFDKSAGKCNKSDADIYRFGENQTLSLDEQYARASAASLDGRRVGTLSPAESPGEGSAGGSRSPGRGSEQVWVLHEVLFWCPPLAGFQD